MPLPIEQLAKLPFGIPTARSLLPYALSPGEIYKRDQIVEMLRSKYVELGGPPITPQEVIAPLKNVLKKPPFERVEHGYYRYQEKEPPIGNGVSPQHPSDGEPAQSEPAAIPSGSKRPHWLAAASKRAEVVAALWWCGRAPVADRLDDLHDLAQDDLEELPIAFDSQRQMALFLLCQPQWPDPEVSVSTDGLAHAEWRFSPFSHPRRGQRHHGHGVPAFWEDSICGRLQPIPKGR